MTRVRLVLSLLLKVGPWLAAAAVAWYGLSPGGYLARSLLLDIHAALVPLGIVIAGAIAVIVARALTPVAWREYAAVALVGLAQAAMAYAALSALPAALRDVAKEARYVPLVAQVEDGALLLARLALPAAFLATVFAAYRLAVTWGEQMGKVTYLPALATATAVVCGAWALLALRYLGPLWWPLPQLGLVILGGALFLAAAMLATYWRRAANPFLAALGDWATTGHLHAFLAGALLLFYVALVRPDLYGHLRYAAALEWVGVGLVLLAVYRTVIGFLNQTYLTVEEEAHWARWVNHHQSVTNMDNADLQDAARFQRAFVELGLKEPLLVYVVSIMAMNEVPQQRIAGIIRPIVQHQDRRSGWLLFPWLRDRIDRRNSAARDELLQEVMGAVRQQMDSAGIRRPSMLTASQETETRRAATPA